MNKIVFSIGIVVLGLSFTACSKCYKCQAPVEIKTSSGTTTQYQEEEFCTASPKELQAKEDDGYTCTSS